MPVDVTEVDSPRKVFTCSDGKKFFNGKKAFKHEDYVRIPTLFPQSAIEWSKSFRAKRYHLCKHLFIRCGIYHIILKEREDMRAMNHFFRGLREALGYPEDEDYPIEFDLEIYYEKIPGTLMDKAQWRLYNG